MLHCIRCPTLILTHAPVYAMGLSYFQDEIMVLFVLRKLILQTRMRSHPVGLDVRFFGQTICVLPYFMCANSDGSGETARMRRLA